MKLIDAFISPASAKAALLAFDLFGRERVDPGSWASPVRVFGLTQDEFDAAQELLHAEGFVLRMISV